MANAYQQAAFRRKISYVGLILGLFVISLFLRGTVTKGMSADVHAMTIEGRANRLEMTELSQQGEAELSGSAIRLLLTGSRGLAICGLWISANEKQVKHEWNELEILVKSITKLQPHFVTPWLFQSWNLTYNVSVELDRLNDMYFYIGRGINLLAQGEKVNKRNPDMRYSIGFYYQNKFSVSDKVNTLRCMYQLSCIRPEDRNPDDLLTPDRKSVDPEKFKTFCETNPQLVRRMRESTVRLETPMDVVRFLRENQKIASRYKLNENELEDRLTQFPVLPPKAVDADDDPDPTLGIPDSHADAVLAARAWFRYGVSLVPPPSKKPSATPTDYDRTLYRVPRQPMLIIYRQGYPRAQTYVADRLRSEGWFDSTPWIVDQDLDPTDRNRWFAETVSIAPSMHSQEAWSKAFELWRVHGIANGLYLTPEELKKWRDLATLFAQHRNIGVDDFTPAMRPEEMNDPRLRESWDAHQTLTTYRQNLQVTNYLNFLDGAEAEMAPETIEARKLLFEAERFRRVPFSNEIKAREVYARAFPVWKRVLNARPKFREVDRTQEDVYEAQVEYIKLIQRANADKLREAYASLTDLMNGASPVPVGLPGLKTRELFKKVPEWMTIEPLSLSGPFDVEDAADGKPWVRPDIKERVLSRLKMIKAPVAPPTPVPGDGTPAEPGTPKTGG